MIKNILKGISGILEEGLKAAKDGRVDEAYVKSAKSIVDKVSEGLEKAAITGPEELPPGAEEDPEAAAARRALET